MESEINLSITITILVFAAIVLYLLLEQVIEKKFLTSEEIVKVKSIIPARIWMPLVLSVPLCSIFFREVFGFRGSFGDILIFSLGLIMLTGISVYQFTKISKINLPAEFVGKWRKLNFAFALVGILFMAACAIWSFVRWQNEGYRIFRSE